MVRSQHARATREEALTVQCPLPPLGCGAPVGEPCTRRSSDGRRVPLDGPPAHFRRVLLAEQHNQLPFHEGEEDPDA